MLQHQQQRICFAGEMHHFDIAPSAPPLPNFRKRGLRQTLPALLLSVPVMRGLRSSSDGQDGLQPQHQQQKSYDWTKEKERDGRDSDDQRWCGDGMDGFREKRGRLGAEASFWSSPFEVRAGGGSRGGYYNGRGRARDERAGDQIGFIQRGGFERRPGSRPGREEYRYWRSAEDTLPDSCEKFVLVSYNILADKNASEHYRGLYYHIPWRLLDWERRKNKVIQELGLWSPDIICLQEVDHFGDLQEELRTKGYEGTYQGRTGGARDGCAMFWRSSRFRLVDEENIQFSEFGLRDNVAQLCALQSIGVKGNRPSDMEADPPYLGASENVVIVGNIHVLFNPKRGDVKLGQVRVLLNSAHELSRKWNNAPVVIGGDFNSTPSSSIYKFLADSELDLSCLNRQNLSGQVEENDGNIWNHAGSLIRVSTVARRKETSESTRSKFLHTSNLPSGVIGPVDANVTLSSQPLDSVVGEAGVSLESSEPCGSLRSDENTSTSECSTSTASGLHTRPAPTSQSCDPVKPWHWTGAELVTATGTASDTVVRHQLRLRSAYTEIEGERGCRDPQGEPLVTTYHKKFMGTVDYIWHTEGLDAVRVLDTLPVHILQRCQGLPSQKWGSDHLALACELAFHLPPKD